MMRASLVLAVLVAATDGHAAGRVPRRTVAISFRIGFGAEQPAGSWRVDDVILTGNASPRPAP